MIDFFRIGKIRIEVFSHPKFGGMTRRTEVTDKGTLWVALVCHTHFLVNILKCSIFL